MSERTRHRNPFAGVTALLTEPTRMRKIGSHGRTRVGDVAEATRIELRDRSSASTIRSVG